MPMSSKQRKVRVAFKNCIDCFNKQPYTGGAEPSGIGPYSRAFWYTSAEASGLFYFDYFIKTSFPYFYSDTTPPWCQ